jgi:ketosteroid isomerase-like protein
MDAPGQAIAWLGLARHRDRKGPSMSSLRELAEQAFQVYNAGDVESLVSLYTEDATLVNPLGTFQGRAAIHEHWSRQQAAFPDRTATLGVTVEQGDTVAEEWIVAGTNTGPLVMPDGAELPPTGKRVEINGMDLVQARDGKVVAQHQYWDSMAVAGQLGLLPEAAT